MIMSETHLRGEVRCRLVSLIAYLELSLAVCSVKYVACVIGVSHKLAMCGQPGKEASWRCELVDAVRSVCASKT